MQADALQIARPPARFIASLTREDPKGPRAALTSDHAHEQRDEKDHDKDKEQHLRYFGSASGDAAKPEDCRDNGDDEKDGSVSKHGSLHQRIAGQVDPMIDPRAGTASTDTGAAVTAWSNTRAYRAMIKRLRRTETQSSRYGKDTR
ncbi:hypothetical protein PTKU64_19740 [Paraburkholderia terrae]|uniref:Uncharacterized protein n=1 Tax=Paraburkholderia terrae TaxID=311230 RepID=A0ABM7TUM8_9BURK|nr:hypothetical protein PTKU64_19740 [Paraburkholderia terrae]